MCIHYARMRIVLKNVLYRLKAAFPKCLTATDSSFTVVCQRSSSRESACSFCCCCCLMACNSLSQIWPYLPSLHEIKTRSNWWPGLTKCQKKAHSDEVIKELEPSFPTGHYISLNSCLLSPFLLCLQTRWPIMPHRLGRLGCLYWYTLGAENWHLRTGSEERDSSRFLCPWNFLFAIAWENLDRAVFLRLFLGW